MPIFYQQQVDDFTRLGIWKIEEAEEFFKNNVPLHRDVTHPHKRLQHLAGRFLLQYLFPDFPYDLIRIADTRRPFLHDEQYHFSISHCDDYAAALVSRNKRVGVDIEVPHRKILKLGEKFLGESERRRFRHAGEAQMLTLLWSAKEAVFKWYGEAGVDFKEDIRLQEMDEKAEVIRGYFSKADTALQVHYRWLEGIALAWVCS
ncbi:MAG TPA: 4'-phosphopantetheinyl transferase superfamily protein [Chitinophagaceae bacterium]|nr:4'-phosphopantetheinyl transferase superfamily protein [Chitinophagaceae bacterium]